MIFLWIDPGTSIVWYAFIEKTGRESRILEYGVITTPAKIPLYQKLLHIEEDLSNLLSLYRVDALGIEKLFFLRNVTNGIDVAQARWVIVHAIAKLGIPILEFTPLQVKQGITGSWNAKKTQVQRAVALIFKLDEIPKPDDAADALAIAYLTALHANSLPKI